MRNTYKKRKEIRNSTNKSLKVDELNNRADYINIYNLSNFPNSSTINKTHSTVKLNSNNNLYNGTIIKNKDVTDRSLQVPTNTDKENFIQKNNKNIINTTDNFKTIHKTYVNNNSKNFSHIVNKMLGTNQSKEKSINENKTINNLGQRFSSKNYFPKYKKDRKSVV